MTHVNVATECVDGADQPSSRSVLRGLVLRVATSGDLLTLQSVEREADQLFSTFMSVDEWADAPTGVERSRMPGFILVLCETTGGPVAGFVHVLLAGHGGHLEQLSVRPAFGRRGYGRALVAAAVRESSRRGFERLTLRTFADIPWNAPFYATCGFHESEPDTDELRAIAAADSAAGPASQGTRVQMDLRFV